MKPSQLLSLLQVAIENRLSVLVRGAPGAGKSDLVTQAAAAAGCDMILMHPAVSQPTSVPAHAGETGAQRMTRAR